MNEKTKKQYYLFAAVLLFISNLFLIINRIIVAIRFSGNLPASSNIFFAVKIITTVFLAVVLLLRKKDKLLFTGVALHYGIILLSALFSGIKNTFGYITALIRNGGGFSLLFFFKNIISDNIFNLFTVISAALIILIAFSLIDKNKTEALLEKKKIEFAPAAASAIAALISVFGLFASNLIIEIKYYSDFIDFIISFASDLFGYIIPDLITGVINAAILLFLSLWIVRGDNLSEEKEKPVAAANISAQPYNNQSCAQNPQQQYYNNTDYTQNLQQYYNNQGYAQNPQQQYYNNTDYTQNPQQYYNNQGYAQNPQQYYNNPDYTQVLRQPDNNQTYAQNPPQTPDEK